MNRFFTYILLITQIVIFPVSLLPNNDYSLMHPDAIIQPDSDTLIYQYALLLLMILIFSAIYLLMRNSLRLEKYIVVGLSFTFTAITIYNRFFPFL